MNSREELDLIVGTLTGKGYDGTMMSESCLGKLNDVVEGYLRERDENRLESSKPLWLSTYLRWNGEDREHVLCDMWIDTGKPKITVNRMIIEKKGQYGIQLKRFELKNLSLDAVPTVQKALDLVSETSQKIVLPDKKSRLKL